ncbi:MAG: hemin uptake protein HemP [Rudaea sp.]|uniref:hemin uptake protein HemP n=1 Tax=unclassified Rudaea TaxID=2627037 RepID=UPI0010F67F03|nr:MULTISPECIES: hemin uptake protein HemP [unclassified Rudaea]MBN8886545.1 hemin uptake protein HemP [Rudaea sp.]MBR0343908.1 hemin uptake protein HemP [Rudaea sp.]
MHTATLPLNSGDVSFRTAAPAPRPHAAQVQRQFDSRTLFGGAQEVRIEHFGQEYRLRQTRNGKLILTK